MTISTRIGTPSNLTTGATYDLFLLDFPDGWPEGLINFNILNNSRKVTGLQKMAQAFFKILMTTKGTNVLRPTEGTLFNEYFMNSNRTGVDNEVYTVMKAEVQSAVKQVQYMYNIKSNTDLSSQLYSVEVLGINVDMESITLFAKLTTMSGETASIGIPAPQLDFKMSGE